MKNVFQSIFRADVSQGLVVPQSDRPILRSLEPRILLDAAAAETSHDIADAAIREQQASEYVERHDVVDTAVEAMEADALAPPLERDKRDEVVFIDGSIDNISQILGSIDQSARVVVLDQESDGVEQIADALEGFSGIDAIHIISHGSAGSLSLGSGDLTLESINGEHADELASIRDALDVNGDILIYGCDFGQGDAGLAAAEALSQATSADIAASDDLTGAESLGGDWDLELQSGQIEARSIEAREFNGVLADTDGDGIDDAQDIDDDNDGIIDERENGDTDGDGINDSVDLDSDNDGISDLSESGSAAGVLYDINSDGTISAAESAAAGVDGNGNVITVAPDASNSNAQLGDVDGDGLLDIFDKDITTGATAASQGTTAIDTDGDGIEDYRDLDSDADYIADAIESRPTANFSANDGLDFANVDYDADNDGILDIYEAGGSNPSSGFGSAHSTFNAPVDSDGDGTADYLDSDSDDDGLLDISEGVKDDVGLVSYTDPDGAVSSTNSLFDVLRDEVAGNNEVAFREVKDTDGDGLVDAFDIDDDNDGILDINEQEELETTGLLGGTVTSVVDPVGVTGPSSIVSGFDEDFEGDDFEVSFANIDSVNKGDRQVYDFASPLSNVSIGFRSVVSEATGTSVAGVTGRASYGNFTITLADGTVLENVSFIVKDDADLSDVERPVIGDRANGNTADFIERVTDSNGIHQVQHAGGTRQGAGLIAFDIPEGALVSSISFQNLSTRVGDDNVTAFNIFGSPNYSDVDQDGVRDQLSLDSDNDGIADAYESGFVVAEQARLNQIIADNDVENSTAEQTKARQDAEARVAKLAEIFADGTVSVSESSEYLSIGLTETVSGDADNDGLMDIFDADINNIDAAASQGVTPVDSDDDGVEDFRDLDSDGDGIADAIEARPTSDFTASDGTAAHNADSDGDGVSDLYDVNGTGVDNNFGSSHANFSSPIDTDGDGIADYLDLNSDNDSLTDAEESGFTLSGEDENGDGIDDHASIGVTYSDPDGVVSSTNSPSDALKNTVNDTGSNSEVDFREKGSPTVTFPPSSASNPLAAIEDAAFGFANGDEDNRIFITAATDAVGDEIYTATFTKPNDGTLSATGAAGVVSTDSGTGLLTIQGTLSQVNAALATLKYTPDNPDFYHVDDPATSDPESDSFVMTLTDGLNANGGVDSNGVDVSQTMYIALAAEQDAFDDAVTVKEGASQVTFNVLDGGTATAADNTDVLSSSIVADNFEKDATSSDAAADSDAITHINGNVITDGQTIHLDADGNTVPAGDASAIGTITVSTDGEIVFNANEADFAGSLTFKYTAQTINGVAETADVTVNYTDEPSVTPPEPENPDQPNSATNPVKGTEDQDLAIPFVINDQDVGETFTVTMSEPSNGVLVATVDGTEQELSQNDAGDYELTGTKAEVNAILATLKYRGNDDYFGADQVNYTLSDGVTNTVTGSLFLDLTPEQDAFDDVIGLNEGETATFNVLAGTGGATADVFEGKVGTVAGADITHVAGAAISDDETIYITEDGMRVTAANDAAALAAGAVGTLSVSPDDGAMSFSSLDPDYKGTVTFDYTANTDEGVAETATVTLNVADIVDPPMPTGPTNNDSDGPNSETNPIIGAEDQTGGIPIEGLQITDEDFVAGADDNETMTVTLNPGDHGTISASAVTGATIATASNGIVTITGELDKVNAALTGLTFVPDADYNTGVKDDAIAPVGIVMTISDGRDDDGDVETTPVTDVTQTIYVEVEQEQDAFDDTIAINEGDTASFNVLTGAGGATADAFEGKVGTVDGADITHVAGAAISDDETIYITADGTRVTAADDAAALAAGAVGTLSVSPDDGAMSFSSLDPDYNGTVTFDYTANTDTGVAETATVTLNVQPVNDGPVAVNDTLSTGENTVATGDAIVGATNGDGMDSDIDGDTLTISQVNGSTNNVNAVGASEPVTVAGSNGGTFTVYADGTYSFDPGTDFDDLGLADEAPNTPETRETTITYEVSDGNGGTDTATITVTVEAENDAPSVIDPETGEPGTPGEGGTPIDPTDPDSPDPIGPTDVNNTGDNLPNRVGFDGQNLGEGFSVAGNFGDVDDVKLTYSFANFPEGLTINQNTGVITADKIAADASQNSAGLETPVPGQYLITVTATDPHGATVTDDFYYFVTNVPPVAANDTDTFVEENNATGNVITGVETTSLLAGKDVDGTPDDDVLNVTQFVVAGNTITVPDDGSNSAPTTIEVDGEAIGTFVMDNAGNYVFDPVENFNGTVPEITYTITDNEGGTSSATLNITGIAVNDAPDANNDNDTYIEETPATGNVITGADTTGGTEGSGVDTDIDGTDTLSVIAFQVAGFPELVVPADGFNAQVIPNVGTITMESDGDYTFTPVDNYNGPVPVVTYTLSDNTGEDNATDTATLTITNAGSLNDAPVANNDQLTVDENETGTGNVIAGATDGAGQDTDLDGDTLMVSQVGTNPDGLEASNVGEPVEGTNGGTFTINPDGSYTFDPGDDFDQLQEGDTATTTVTYEVTDGNGGVDTATVEVTVEGSNDAPSVLIVDPENPEGELIPGVPGQPGTPGTDDPDDLLGNENSVDGETITPINVAPNFTDIDDPDETLTYSAANLPEGLTISPDGMITGTLSPDASQGGPNEDGVYTVIITAEDPHGATVTDTFTYTVTNPVPVANNDTDTVEEDGLTAGNVITGVDTTTAPNGSGVDQDPDGDDLSVTQIMIGDETIVVPQTGETVTHVIPDVGEFTIDKDGNYTFEPEDDYTGDVPEITYTITDGQTDASGQPTSDTATLSLDISPVNDAPEANPDRDTFTEGNPATGNVLTGEGTTTGDSGADTDPEDDPLTVTQFEVNGTIIEVPEGGTGTHEIEGVGTIEVAPNGDYTFTPEPGYTGDVPPITYTVTDGTDTDEGTLSIFNDDGVNEDPVATDDVVTIGENDTADGNAVTNDTDPDGDGLTVTEVAGQPVAAATSVPGNNGGTFTVNPDGTWTFDPGNDFDHLGVNAETGEPEMATTQVSYQISDGNGGTSTANIIVNITGENDAPSIIDPETGEPGTPGQPGTPGTDDPNDPLGNQNGTDGEAITPIDVTANFGDVDDNDANDPEDGDDLTYTAEGLPEGLVLSPEGEITGTIDPSASTGGPNEDGVYTVTVTATDPNGEIVTDTFTYTVANPVPVANNDDDTFTEDQPATGNVLTGADTDTGAAGADTDTAPDSDPLSVTQFEVAGETIEVPQTGIPVSHEIPDVGTITVDSNGNYTFDPVENYDQNVPEITYTVSDGNGGTDTATLNIAADPVNDAPDANNDVDTYSPGTDSTGNVITGADTVSGETGADTDVDNAAEDLSVTQFEVNGTTVAVPAGGSGSTTIAGVGTIEMSSDGSYTFTPEAGLTGDVPVITYTLSDGSETDDAELHLVPEGSPINGLPVAENDEVTIQETDDGVPAGQNVLGNDSDPDDDPLTVTEVEGQPVEAGGTTVPGDNGGTFTINPDGTWTFDPGEDFEGLAEGQTETTTVTYTVSDGNGGETEAEIIVNVEGENASPSVVTPEGEIGVPGTDGTPPDEGSESLGPEAGTPAEGQDQLPNRHGEDGNEITEFSVAGNFDDTDNDDNSNTLIYSAANLPEGLSISEDGTIQGTLSPDASIMGDNPETAPGVYTVEIIATDSHGAAVSDTFTFTATNPVPVAQDDVVTVTEDVTATGNVISGDGTNQNADGTPMLDANGNPTGMDSDPDGDDLTVTQFEFGGETVTIPADGSASHTIDGVGTLTMTSEGDYTFTPEPNYDGDVPVVTYTIADGQQDAEGNPATDTATLTLNMEAVNDGPVAQNDVDQFIEDTDATGNVITGADTLPDSSGNVGEDTDVDTPQENLFVTQFQVEGFDAVVVPEGGSGSIDIPEMGTFTLNSDGSYVFNPIDNFNGQIPVISYTISDGELTDDAELRFQEGIDRNDPPVAVDDAATTTEDDVFTSETGLALANDTDPENDALTVVKLDGQDVPAGGLTLPGVKPDGTPGGLFTIMPDGTWTFDPNGDFEDLAAELIDEDTPANNRPADTTTSTITYEIVDSEGGESEVATITMTITGENEAPSVVSPEGEVGLPGVDGTDPGEGTETAGPEAGTPADGEEQLPNREAQDGDTITEFSVAGNFDDIDSDDDGSTLEYSIINPPPGLTITDEGLIAGSLAANASELGDDPINKPGVYTVTVVATDSHGESVRDTFIYTVTNRPPLANDDMVQLLEDPSTPATGNVISGNGTNLDADGNPLLDADGNPTGMDSDTAPDNDDLTLTQFEVSGQTIVLPVPSDDEVTSATQVIDGVGTLTMFSDGQFTFDPVENFNGDVPSVLYTISDGSVDAEGQPTTAQATLTFDIEAVNDALEANDDAVTVDEGNDATLNLLENDEDIDGDELTVTQVVIDDVVIPFDTPTEIEGGTITVSEDGDVTFTPDEDFVGTISGTYTATDGTTTDDAELVINVNDVNDPPVANDDQVTVDENEVGAGNVIDGAADGSGQDTDVDGDTLMVSQVGTNSNGLESGNVGEPVEGTNGGTFIINPDGTYSFDPGTDFDGLKEGESTTTTVTYEVSDGNGGVDTATVEVVVEGSNDALEANDDEVTAEAGNDATLNLLDNDVDIDGDELTVTEVVINNVVIPFDTPTEIEGGIITVSENGNITFTPDLSFSGSITGTYTATDGTATDSAEFVINVPAQGSVPLVTTDPLGVRDSINADFNVDGGIITRTVQGIQNLNRPQEEPLTSDGPTLTNGTSYETASAIFNFGLPEGLIGDYIAIDLGTFDGDTLIAEGLITSEDIVTADADEEVLKLFVNTYVRQNILYIDIANNENNLDKTVVKNYRIASLDGSELPSWIRMARDGFVIAEPPADVRSIDLMITAELEDGSTINRAVSVESLTGVIQMANLNADEIERAQGFTDKLKSEVNDSVDDIL